jgi:hypothetical protein
MLIEIEKLILLCVSLFVVWALCMMIVFAVSKIAQKMFFKEER